MHCYFPCSGFFFWIVLFRSHFGPQKLPKPSRNKMIRNYLMPIFSFLLIVYVLITCLPCVASIKCWVCHSDSDPKCADPFDNTTLPIKDCREVKRSHLLEDESPYDILMKRERDPQYKPQLKTATMCRKIRQKIHGNWRTIRDCAFLGSPGEGTGNEHNCLYRKGTYDIYLEYCTCNSKDGCNGSWLPSSNINFIIAMVIIASTLLLSPWPL